MVVFKQPENSGNNSTHFFHECKIEKIEKIDEMDRIFRLPSLFSFFLIISQASSSNQPLIFDPYSWEIYDPQNPPEYFRFAAACPATTDDEKFFNEVSSFDKNALFVKGHFKTYQEVLSKVQCDQNIDLSVVYHHANDGKAVEFGYEIYFNKSDFHHGFENYDYKKFGNVMEAASKTKRFLGKQWKRPFAPTLVKRGSLLNNLKVGSGQNSLGFIWIQVITLKFKRSFWLVKSLSYEIDGSSRQRKAIKCSSNTMGHILYKKTHLFDKNYATALEEFYSPSNQGKVLKDAVLPNTLGEDCKIRHKCVMKYNLAPYYFRPSDSEDTSCSDLTSIPLWYELNKTQLDYLNKFLISIARITKGTFIIHDGVLDPIILRLKYHMDWPMYLNTDEKKLPVPRLIYKIVIYETYDCLMQKYLCWFGLIIVIHNQPDFPNSDKVCSEDKCKEWGWDSIQYASSSRTEKKSTYIYCCPILGGAPSNLNIDWDYSIIIEDLKLNNFPYYDGRIHRHRYENRQLEFEKKHRKWSESNKSKSTSGSDSELNENEKGSSASSSTRSN